MSWEDDGSGWGVGGRQRHNYIEFKKLPCHVCLPKNACVPCLCILSALQYNFTHLSYCGLGVNIACVAILVLRVNSHKHIGFPNKAPKWVLSKPTSDFVAWFQWEITFAKGAKGAPGFVPGFSHARRRRRPLSHGET